METASERSLDVIGHRGARSLVPENTITGFRRAAADGASGIELDVRVSRDGVPIIMHDEDISATTDGSGLVGELTVAELDGFDPGDGCGIPTLRQALDSCTLTVQVEVKNPDDVGPVMDELAQRSDRERFVLTSSVTEVLRRAGAAGYDATPIGFIPRHLDDDAIATARELGATWLYPGIDGSTARAVAAAHEEGMTVHMWMVNDLPTLQHAIELGVDGVTSDDPGAVVAWLRDLDRPLPS